jgi:phospholipase C
VRVPAVLVSPLIAPGTVYRVPAGSATLDHTSILKTVQQRWGLPALTARDAAAPGFGDVLTLTTPRTDDVLAGVTVPTSSSPGPSAGMPSHLQEIQAELVSRQFPAGRSAIPGTAGPAPVTDAALASYIRANA